MIVENVMSLTYLTPRVVLQRMACPTKHIPEYLKDRIFVERYHYVRTPSGRRPLFFWKHVKELVNGDTLAPARTPPAAGACVNG